MQQPTVGRIVHYVMPESHRRAGEIRPAVVVRVWKPIDDPAHPGMSNLQVLLDGSNDGAGGPPYEATMWAGSVLHSAEPKPNTWHWPPRG